MANLTVTVGPTGRDFTTLQAAWDSLPSTVASEDHYDITMAAGLYTAGLDVTATAKTISGTVLIKPEPGAAWHEAAGSPAIPVRYDNTKGVTIEASPFLKPTLYLKDRVSVEGLQGKGGGAYGWIGYSLSVTAASIKRCLVAADDASTACLFLSAGFAGAIANNVFITSNTANVEPVVINDTNGTILEFVGNTVISTAGSSGNWNRGQYGTGLRVRDCAVFGFASTDAARINAANSSNNATDQATFPGTSNVTSLTAADQFESASGTLDLRPKAGSDLVAGVTHALITIDALGQTRAATPTIGAVEYAAGGSPPAGTVTIGTITHDHDSASIPWTYDAEDATGFEYSLDTETWADAGTSPLALSGLTPETAYSIQIRPKNASGAGTASTAANFTTDAAPGDTTAPTLTSPTGTATGSTTASGSVSTDEANGTLYAVCTTSSTAPSVAQVQAGTDDSDVAAAYATSQAVSGTGEQDVAATGLTEETSYYWHFQQKDAAGNDSAVVSSASFTTDAANAAPTFPGPDIGAQSGTEGVALTPLDVSGRFSDTDALTFSAVGSWPPGVTVSSAGVINGTPTTAGTYSSLQVRATDTAAQTVDSDTFAFTIAAAEGTITTSPLKNNTGTLLASETGATVHVYETTGALVVTKAGQSTDASGIMTITDALIVPETEYRIVIVLGSGAEGMDRITAA